MNLFVGNLAREITQDDLLQAFSAFGQVLSATIIKDKFSGQAAVSNALPPAPPLPTSNAATPSPDPLALQTNSQTTTGQSSSDCSMLLPGSGEIPKGFAPPWDVRSAEKTLMLQVNCLPDKIENIVTVGNGSDKTYIYTKGYQSVNNVWKSLIFTCTKKIGTDWCLQKAGAGISAKAEYVIAYSCTTDSSTPPAGGSGQAAWHCGCKDQQCAQNYWQIQKIKK